MKKSVALYTGDEKLMRFKCVQVDFEIEMLGLISSEIVGIIFSHLNTRHVSRSHRVKLSSIVISMRGLRNQLFLMTCR